jgi:hypothetical protein
LVALAPLDGTIRDRFFVMTMTDLQDCCVRHYKTDMDKRGWRRPKNPASFHISYEIEEIEAFEDNWTLIGKLLQQ